MKHDNQIYRAAELLSRHPLREEFAWPSLFGEADWREAIKHTRAQTLGAQLGRYFSGGPNPVIEFVRVNRSPRMSVWRKIREMEPEE